MSSTAAGTPIAAAPSFRWLASHPITTLNLELQEFEHLATGARHFHLKSDDDQLSFMVAFKTVPTDSTGVAHILEHTTLCGSHKYPVRDPFFLMTRRSLNTFMNAFTSSDWTAYPFASRNRKDFANLLQVYLDAVFFPNLNPLDFAQEGHRLDFSDSNDANSPLEFKGVVYNEMKGAMSSPVSALWQSLTSALFPTNTYHYNSGGEPAVIPELTYEALKAFHQRHYHPSNATFMTYGDIDAASLQQEFETLALAQFQRLNLNIEVELEQRYTTPQQFTDRYAIETADENESATRQKTHIVLGWLLQESSDAEAVMRANLLSGVLLDNSASPLRQVLETSDLGLAPSPLCGVQDSTREMIFACGLEGSDPENADAVEALILNTLKNIAENGVDQEQVEAILHQLELSQREVSGDGFPYGLQLMVHALGATLHGADPVALLDIDPVIERLRRQITDPDFIKGLVRELLDNPHRIRLVMSPDPQLAAEREAAEQEKLAQIAAKLTAEERQAVANAVAALAARQAEDDDVELLPRVGLEDIPVELKIPEGKAPERLSAPTTWYGRSTNGLVYQHIIIQIPDLDAELIPHLPLFTDVVTEVGSGGRDYLATAALQAKVSGGLNAAISLRGSNDDVQQYRSFLSFSGKALLRNSRAMAELLFATFHNARFDEYERLRELISQERMHQEQRITSSGHSLAMAAAASCISPTAAINHQWGGLAGIAAIKALDEQVADDGEIRQLSDKLQQIAQALQQSPRQLLLIARPQDEDEMVAALSDLWQPDSGSNPSTLQLPAVSGQLKQAWATSTQVNFCARAYATVPSGHADAPALMVLGGFLRNNFLHRAIREQGGAYGGGAGYDSDSSAFRFYSYRDPRLNATLNDFDNAISWLLEKDHPKRLLEEAILGVISTIDKPGSPAGEAMTSFYATLHGRTPERRRALREQVLQVTLADLQRVGEHYLQPALAHTAVISSAARLEQEGDGFAITRL
ncbi:MAG: insulinase family protein [Gammaproteobacteria bacterium]|nr:insulinase family protein [Gammaproteobacteria bacterium]